MSAPGGARAGVGPVPTAALEPMRWWHVAAAAALEPVLFGASAWSAELFWSELAAPGRTYLVALEPGRGAGAAGDGAGGASALLGYGGLALGGDDADVQTLAVAPGAQGRGLGGLLLDALLAVADAAAAPAVLLEVRADNGPAQRLYASRGFERVGVRRRYYQPEDVDALVLRRRRPRTGA